MQGDCYVAEIWPDETLYFCLDCDRLINKGEYCIHCTVNRLLKKLITDIGLEVISYFNYDQNGVWFEARRGRIEYGDYYGKYRDGKGVIENYNYDFYRDEMVKYAGMYLNEIEREELTSAVEDYYFKYNHEHYYFFSSVDYETYVKFVNFEQEEDEYKIDDDLSLVCIRSIKKNGDPGRYFDMYKYKGEYYPPIVLTPDPLKVEIKKLELIGDFFVINDVYKTISLTTDDVLYCVINDERGIYKYVRSIF